MWYIANARVGGFYKRDADKSKSGFRIRHADADTFETAEAAQAVIDAEKLLFSSPAFFSTERVAEIEEARDADVATHEQRAALRAEHFSAQQNDGTAETPN